MSATQVPYETLLRDFVKEHNVLTDEPLFKKIIKHAKKPNSKGMPMSKHRFLKQLKGELEHENGCLREMTEFEYKLAHPEEYLPEEVLERVEKICAGQDPDAEDEAETPVCPASPEIFTDNIPSPPPKKKSPTEDEKRWKEHRKNKKREKKLAEKKKQEKAEKTEANKKLKPQERKTRSPPSMEHCCQSRIWAGNPDKRIKGQVSYPNVRCKNATASGELYCNKCLKLQDDKPARFCGNIFDNPPEKITWQGKDHFFYGNAIGKNGEQLSIPVPNDKLLNKFFVGRDQLPWFDKLCEEVGFECEEATKSNLFGSTNLAKDEMCSKANGCGAAGFTM